MGSWVFGGPFGMDMPISEGSSMKSSEETRTIVETSEESSSGELARLLHEVDSDSDTAESDWDSDVDAATTDEQQELHEWLGQLDALGKELESVRPPEPAGMMPNSTEHRLSDETSADETRPKLRHPPPLVPPKPQMDCLRYSMANIEDSAEIDLDALIGELNDLEVQLTSENSEGIFNQWNKPRPNQYSNLTNGFPGSLGHLATAPLSLNGKHFADHLKERVGFLAKSDSFPLEERLGDAKVKTALQSPNLCKAEPTHAAESKPHWTGETSPPSHFPLCGAVGKTLPQQASNRGSSPDGDSAFCDSFSTVSFESNLSSANQNNEASSRNSNGSSSESSRGSINTPSPTQTDDLARIKAEKIKVALEKMKEASIKKLYVKFFTEAGGSKNLLVDERWSVNVVLQHLAERQEISLTHHHAIVEQYPDLYMERIYEDNENLVENVMMWTRDSQNKLLFARRDDKYDLFEHPEVYLLGASSTERQKKLDPGRKKQLIQEFFAPSPVHPPEMEGTLYLKADGKKTWKKHHFVLRASGLYYIPKGKPKQTSKELSRLMSLEHTQVYRGVGWKKKYKAPSEFGFALKHPQIQVKTAKYIKYLCAEDEPTFKRWIVGLRIAKNGRQLLENYENFDTSPSAENVRTSECHLKTSASEQNCLLSTPQFPHNSNNTEDNSSITMRTRSLSSQESAGDSLKLRPKSENILRRTPRRNSKNLFQVDLPTIPSEPEVSPHNDEEDKIVHEDHGTHSLNSEPPPLARSAGYTSESSLSDGSQAAYHDSQATAFFDSDSSGTGTIKRQPAPGAPWSPPHNPQNANGPHVAPSSMTNCNGIDVANGDLRRHTFSNGNCLKALHEQNSLVTTKMEPAECAQRTPYLHLPQSMVGYKSVAYSKKVMLEPILSPTEQLSPSSESFPPPPSPLTLDPETGLFTPTTPTLEPLPISGFFTNGRTSESTHSQLNTFSNGGGAAPKLMFTSAKPTVSVPPRQLEKQHSLDNGLFHQELQQAMALRLQKIEEIVDKTVAQYGSTPNVNGFAHHLEKGSGPGLAKAKTAMPPPPPPKRNPQTHLS